MFGISKYIPVIYQAYEGGLHIRGIYQAYSRHIPEIGVPDGGRLSQSAPDRLAPRLRLPAGLPVPVHSDILRLLVGTQIFDCKPGLTGFKLNFGHQPLRAWQSLARWRPHWAPVGTGPSPAWRLMRVWPHRQPLHTAQRPRGWGHARAGGHGHSVRLGLSV